jgi:hypothetical protein
METSMNLKLVVVVSLFAAMPTLAYAQKGYDDVSLDAAPSQ